jgi:hypothetical protein
MAVATILLHYRTCAQKHVFVGREIGGFEVRQINHLRAKLKKGDWADGVMRFRFKTTIQRETRHDKVDWSDQILISEQFTLVVESQLDTADALVSFDAYTIGKLPNHKGR